MKRIYVTSQCCAIRRAVFASDDINRERPCKHGDYDRWPYGVRETRRIANWNHPCVKSHGAGYDMYITRTARAVLCLLGLD